MRWTKLAEQRHTLFNTCWMWTGGKDRYGYAREKNGKRTDRLHHLIVKERIASGAVAWTGAPFVARHLCGVKACVNPQHLAPGTKRQNKADERHHALCSPQLPTDQEIAAMASTLPPLSANLLGQQTDEALRQELLRRRLAVDQSTRGGDGVADVVFREWAAALDHNDEDQRLLLVLTARKKRQLAGLPEPGDTGLRTLPLMSAPD